MSILRLSNIGKKFKSRILINSVSYCFEQGKVYCITGDNGTGKTTLFNIITNLTSFDGEVFIDDLRNTQIKDLLSKKICYIPQFSCLLERSTLKQNYELCHKITNQPLKSLYNQNKSVSKLSGGQKKMSNLVRINDTYDIYLLDEPTSYLDQKNTIKLYERILKLKEKNKIVIIISHDKELIDFCDVVVNIKEMESIKAVQQTALPVSRIKEAKKIKIKLACQEFLGFIKENFLGNILRFTLLTILLVCLFVLGSLSLKSATTERQKHIQEYYSSMNLIKKEDSKTSLIDDYYSGVLTGGYLSKITHSSYLMNYDKGAHIKTVLFDRLETGIAISDYYMYKLFDTTDEKSIIGQTLSLKHYGTSSLKITRIIKTNYQDYVDSKGQFIEAVLDSCEFVIIYPQDVQEDTLTSYTLLKGNYYFPNEYNLNQMTTVYWITSSFWEIENYQFILTIILVISFLALGALAIERNKLDNRRKRAYKLKVLGCDKEFIGKLGFYETLSIHLLALGVSFAVSCFVFKLIWQDAFYNELLINNIVTFNYSYWLTFSIIAIIFVVDFSKYLLEKRVQAK